MAREKRGYRGHCVDMVAAFLLFMFLLLGTFVLLFIPEVFKEIYGKMGFKESYGVYANLVTETLWTDASFRDIKRIGGFLSDKEVTHFEDIRVILGRMKVGLVCATVLLLGIARFVRWRRATLYSTGLLLVICVSLVTWAAIDWLHMFETLHYWLFQNDSWRLPTRSVTLRLFPYRVWEVMGAVVLGCLVIGHLGCALAAWVIPRAFQKAFHRN